MNTYLLAGLGDSLEILLDVCDRPHHLMEADLNYYPPGTESRLVLRLQAREAS